MDKNDDQTCPFSRHVFTPTRRPHGPCRRTYAYWSNWPVSQPGYSRPAWRSCVPSLVTSRRALHPIRRFNFVHRLCCRRGYPCSIFRLLFSLFFMTLRLQVYVCTCALLSEYYWTTDSLINLYNSTKKNNLKQISQLSRIAPIIPTPHNHHHYHSISTRKYTRVVA